MTAVVEAQGIGKRYRGRWALQDFTLDIPVGHVVGLVGPNGAGKSTFLNLAAGLLEPTTGSIKVLGETPAHDAAHLARVGFVAQDTPTYSNFSVRDQLRFGAAMNLNWDQQLAESRIERLSINPRQHAGKLSGGQRAQLALTLAIAKRPEILILDEPVASLDPLARREFLQILMETVAESQISVILSSHLVTDIERVADYLVVLSASKVQLAGDVDELLASHHRLIGPRRDSREHLDGQHVIDEQHNERQSTYIVRSDGPIADPSWQVESLSLEDLLLAYMGRDRNANAFDRETEIES